MKAKDKVLSPGEKFKVNVRRLLDKPIPDWNCNDMIFWLRLKVKEHMNIWLPFQGVGKDQKLMKQLIEGYNPEVIKNAIEFLCKNYSDFGFDGHPNVGLLYGWRERIIPASMAGSVSKKKKHREWTGEKAELVEGKGKAETESSIGEW